MRKIVSLLIFLSLPFLAVFFVQCCRCPTVEKNYTKINKISFFHQDTLTRNDTAISIIPVERHLIKIKANLESIVFERSIPIHSTVLISSGYAFRCECAEEGGYGLKVKIKTVDVILTEDYDSKHTRGSLINDLVYLKGRYENSLTPINKASLLMNSNLGYLYGAETELMILHTSEFYKLLSNKPDGLPLAIKLKFTFDDNSSIETATQKVILTN